MEKEFYIKKADEFYNNKDYENLFEMYKKLMELEENPKYYFKLGFSLYMLKNYIEAIEYLEKALDNNIENEIEIDYFYYLGLSYYNINDFENAIKYLKIYLKSCSYNSCPSYKYKKALKYYTNIIDTDKENFENYRLIGICYYRLENYYSAIEYFEKSNRLYEMSNKKDYYIKLWLGISYYRVDKYKKAIENLLEAKDICDSEYILYYYIGLCYMCVKDYINAIENFNKQLILSNENSRYTICYLSICYYQLKDYKNHFNLIKEAGHLKKENTKKYSFSKCL